MLLLFVLNANSNLVADTDSNGTVVANTYDAIEKRRNWSDTTVTNSRPKS